MFTKRLINGLRIIIRKQSRWGADEQGISFEDAEKLYNWTDCLILAFQRKM